MTSDLIPVNIMIATKENKEYKYYSLSGNSFPILQYRLNGYKITILKKLYPFNSKEVVLAHLQDDNIGFN